MQLKDPLHYRGWPDWGYKYCKRSEVPGLGFRVEDKSNNSKLIRTRHRIYLPISAYSRANSVAGSDECGLADGISIFRPNPLNL